MSEWPQVVPTVTGLIILFDVIDFWPILRSFRILTVPAYWPFYIVRALVVCAIALYAPTPSDIPPFVFAGLVVLAVLGIGQQASFTIGGFNIIDLRNWLKDYREKLIEESAAGVARAKMAGLTTLKDLLLTKGDKDCLRRRYRTLLQLGGDPATSSSDPAPQSTAEPDMDDIALQLATTGWEFCRDCLPVRERLKHLFPIIPSV